MADSNAYAPHFENIALTTAYTGTWRKCRGKRQIQIVSSTGATVAYTVKTKHAPTTGGAPVGDENVETVPAGSSPYSLPLAAGQEVWVDVLVASSTATAYLTVT